MSRAARALRGAASLAVAAAVAASCATLPLPFVDEAMAAVASAQALSLEQLQRGRHLMVTNCAACHQPVHPDALAFEQWEQVLPRMLEKSDLTPAHGADIRAYIVAVRALGARSPQ
ncbi:MAG TPA: hypothetical protein VFZ65_08555 [Planctomycetota bacterium]|nr:hypothetical protein [Planctomycetota bacterium]